MRDKRNFVVGNLAKVTLKRNYKMWIFGSDENSDGLSKFQEIHDMIMNGERDEQILAKI